MHCRRLGRPLRNDVWVRRGLARWNRPKGPERLRRGAMPGNERNRETDVSSWGGALRREVARERRGVVDGGAATAVGSAGAFGGAFASPSLETVEMQWP